MYVNLFTDMHIKYNQLNYILFKIYLKCGELYIVEA